MDIDELFRTRPFKIRNADEYDIANILNLFVSPIDGLTSPFDYENTIIKGRMGSGKTMYLRANHAYYVSSLVPSLMDKSQDLILPVFIRLSDFRHLSKSEDIYRAIIIKIVEELTSIYVLLENAKKLAELHTGMRMLVDQAAQAHKLSSSLRQLAKLGSEEYIDRVSTELGLDGGVKPGFFDASASWKKTEFKELKTKPNPGIKDIEDCYKNLLEDQAGQVLLLIDEAGSLDKSFFRDSESAPCSFEILMNQFRTASFIRTKIAVYPNSYSDMLTETRYGDAVFLEDSVISENAYKRFRGRALHIIQNYLNPHCHIDGNIKPETIFDLPEDDEFGDALEQILFASNGNMRRLIQLLDLAMNCAYSEGNCATQVNKNHALETLRQHAERTESLFNEQEKEFLNTITSVCKARSACKFSFPNVPLYKYTGKSQEYNLINVEQLGTGRRSTVYAIDYSYAVLKDLPTHRKANSEKVSHDRSLKDGQWISRVATISQELIDHASLPGKEEGVLDYLRGDSGFITSDSGEQVFFSRNEIIAADKDKKLITGKRLRYFPASLGDSKMASAVEVL